MFRLAIVSLGCLWLGMTCLAKSAGPPAELEAEVKRQLEARVDKELAPSIKALCQRLEVPYPPKPPQRSKAAIQAEIDRAAEKAIAERLPADPEAQFREAAKEEYPLKKEGDELELETRGGGRVQGTLTTTNQYYVKVGGTRVSRRDLTADSLASVDPKVNQELRDRFVQRKLNFHEIAKDDIREEVEKELGRDLYLKNGYARYREAWVPADDLIDRALIRKRRALMVKLHNEVAKQVYTRHGYVRVGGRWEKLSEITGDDEPADTEAATEPGAAPEAGEAPPPPPPENAPPPPEQPATDTEAAAPAQPPPPPAQEEDTEPEPPTEDAPPPPEAAPETSETAPEEKSDKPDRKVDADWIFGD